MSFLNMLNLPCPNLVTCLSVLGLTLSSSLAAQQNNDTNKKKGGAELVVTTLAKWEGKPLYLPMPRKRGEAAFPRDKNKSRMKEVEVRVLGMTRYPYKRGTSLTFYWQEEGEEGEKIYKPAFKVALPPAIKQPLIVLSKLPGQTQIASKVYEFHPSSYRAGSLRFSNISSQPVGILAGGKRFVINPGDSHTAVNRKSERKRVKIETYLMDENNGDTLLESRDISWMVHHPRRRITMFIYRSQTPSGRPVAENRMLVDSVPLPSK